MWCPPVTEDKNVSMRAGPLENGLSWRLLCSKFIGACSQEQEGVEAGLGRRGENLSCEVVTDLSGSAEAGLTFRVVLSWARWLYFIPLHQPVTGVGSLAKGVVTFVVA